MRSFILTDLQAGKLPRWGLLGLCAMYALPGLVGRDPWYEADAAGFGVALTMARGVAADWLMPNVFGVAVTEHGPLPFWIAALAIHALPFASEHSAVRAAFLGLMALVFVAMWYATWAVARRPGVQPSDPFGASASRTDVGRAIADSGLLVLLATLGLVARLHETTANAAQVAWIALFLWGCARALDRPGTGGALAGLAAAASLLTTGWPLAAALLAAAMLLPMVSPTFALVRGRFRWAVLVAALAVALPWPLMLGFGDAAGSDWLRRWLMSDTRAVSGPDLRNLGYLLRTLPWYLWPAWPVAVWAGWRWRDRLGEPAVALPLVTLAMLLLPALAGRTADEGQLLPLVPAIAMLAAVGLPTLRRGVVSLIDWFAVMTFTLLGIAIWAYWLALMTGVPRTMAFKAAQLAPGFKPDWDVHEILLAAIASAAWLLLVAWRVSRQPPMIWRAMALSGGGLVLTWFLLMTLWLPMFNGRNTYRDIAMEAAARIAADHDCVIGRAIGLTERASFAYFGGLRWADEAARPGCGWLIVRTDVRFEPRTSIEDQGWALQWEGSRPREPNTRFRLYRRAR